MIQPPVYSPVGLSSLLGGAGALLSGGAAASAEVRQQVVSEYRCDDVRLLDSGTSALMVALRASERVLEERGRTPAVALPAYGCFDLATAVAGTNLKVIPYDIVPRTLGPDWNSLTRALERGAGVVLMAHWYGVPVDAKRVLDLANRHEALVIDDAAQGVGARIGEQSLGTFGDFGVLSFGRGKGRTGGGGGALLGLSAAAREALQAIPLPGARRRGLREYAALDVQWALGRPSLYWIPASLPFLNLGDTPYHEPGPIEPMPASCAGALAQAWPRAAAATEERRAFAQSWRAMHPQLVYPGSEVRDAVPGELRVAVIARNLDERETLLATAPGAMPGYPAALPSLPALRERLGPAEAGQGYAGADELVQYLVTVAGRAGG